MTSINDLGLFKHQNDGLKHLVEVNKPIYEGYRRFMKDVIRS